MPALMGFSLNSIPRSAPCAVGAATCRPVTEPTLRLFPSNRKLRTSTAFECRAASSSSSSSTSAAAAAASDVGYDLYDLLGVESSSDQSQIKNAYRALQKHCHPDVAGPPGHDMAIILNEAYAVLSDPNARSAYDKERAKKAAFRGYTGEPLYSVWFGPESEPRAVFVDEVRCIGCLKCAFFASNTFAIESAYGRARVVGQWADPKHKILSAIDTCPVDCISIVARSDLAALEYLMSKQPRSHVRMTGSCAGGAGVSYNIFADVNKFQRRYSEMKDKTSTTDVKESQRKARASAVQGIRSISSWWFRQSHAAFGSKQETRRNLVRLTGRRPTAAPNTKRLQEAAARRRAAGETPQRTSRKQPKLRYSDEYWTPALLLPSPSKGGSATEASASRPAIAEKEKTTVAASSDASTREFELQGNPMIMRVPEIVAAVAAAMVGFDGGEKASGGLKEHVGGTVALEIVNSFWMQILLAGITWYLIGAAIAGVVGVLGSSRFRR